MPSGCSGSCSTTASRSNAIRLAGPAEPTTASSSPCARTLRWCSDHLEIHARNREVVRIVFVIDACDREIIAWSAVANAGISGEMV